MKTIPPSRTLGKFLLLSLLCACATKNSNHSNLPADVPMNKGAGEGKLLIVAVRMECGKELPMVVDTGTSGTLFDKSLEPKLGKPVGTAMIKRWGRHEKENVYAMPKLYVANTPLVTNSKVVTLDLTQPFGPAGQHIKGILGMDVLKNYCIQLDFAAGKMRFLDGERINKKKLGRAFSIVALNSKDDRPSVDENLLGVHGSHSLIDSGYDADGWLMPKFYRQWTNQIIPQPKESMRSPGGLFGGETYQNVFLRVQDVESDGIGLRFLARHLVTLDFPKQTLYLRRAIIKPTVSGHASRHP